MSNEIVLKPTAFLKRLMRAQDGKCFHCDLMMAWKPAPGTKSSKKSQGVTREHVFPHASTGKGLIYNIVLAHGSCNGKRGDRQPTPIEIAKAAAIYRVMGLEPFVPKAEYERRFGPLRQPRQEAA